MFRTKISEPSRPVLLSSAVILIVAATLFYAARNGSSVVQARSRVGGDSIPQAASAAAARSTNTVATTVTDANVDFNGDGKTDYVVARGTSSPLAEATAPTMVSLRPFDPEVRRQPGQTRHRPTANENLFGPPIFWYSDINGTNQQGVGQLGDSATDFIVVEDFDGDGKDDPTVWTEAPGGQANFKIFQSSTNTVRLEYFGQTNDDPAVIGDYDGDGKADPAVYRCPQQGEPAGQCYFFYRGSLNNPSGNVTYVPWGYGNDGDFFPYVGDFDGDGKNDFCVQASVPGAPSQGVFYLAKSGGGAEYIGWGLSTDFIIPGDYDGDGKTDFCVRRTSSGVHTYYLLTRTGATSQVQWGITGDASAPGDYDGDGKTDIATWRGSQTPGDSRYWILNSSNGSITQFTWGQCTPGGACDFPVAGWAVH